QAGKVAGQTVKDAQDSTEGFASYLHKSLPSIPYTGWTASTGTVQKAAPGDPKKATGQTSKTANEATGRRQSYAQQAASYHLPSLPSMPSLITSNKGQTAIQPKSLVAKATDSATKASEMTTSAAKDTASVVSDSLTPTGKNTLNPKSNPAVKSR